MQISGERYNRMSFVFDFVTEALLDFVTGAVDANELFGLAPVSAARALAAPLPFRDGNLALGSPRVQN